MNPLKKYFALLLAMVLCLGLTACSGSNDIIGADWRTWGITRDGGTITCGGEEISVLVCVNKMNATLYYDTEDQTPFGWVDYPITFGDDVWDLFKGIDFSDLNGDGDSDVTMWFDGDITLVWHWDAGSRSFEYQPDKSSTGDRRSPDEIYHELLERFYVLAFDPGSNMDNVEDGEYGVLEAAQGLGDDALNGIGYLIKDLSDDGVPELVVGSLCEYGGEVYALYTLVGSESEPELVFEGWSRNSYTYVNAYVGGSSCFYNYGSRSTAESCQGVFTLSWNGQEQNWRRFYFTYAEDGDLDNVTLYTNTTGSWDPEESEVAHRTLDEYYELLSAPVVDRVISFWAIDCTESGLDLMPFSAWGDLVPDDGDAVPVLMGGALPFTNMETLQSENYEDGTYYYADVAEDGQVIVVNTVLPRDFLDDGQTLEDYLTGCALDLGEAGTWSLQSVEKNEAYSVNMSYPVYILTYTTGRNEDTREWTVFAMDTDRYTYLYGFGVSIDAADDEMKSVYQDIFAGLYLSDGE